jgi:hypothetical protein
MVVSEIVAMAPVGTADIVVVAVAPTPGTIRMCSRRDESADHAQRYKRTDYFVHFCRHFRSLLDVRSIACFRVWL